MAPEKKFKYEVGHSVMLKEQKESTFGYAAKVIKTERVDGVNKYTFHYNGWNSRWDKTHNEDELGELVYEWSKEAEQESKIKQREMTRTASKKKKQSDEFQKRKSEAGGSRGSTPSATSEKRKRRGDDTSSVGSHEEGAQPREALQKKKEIRINIPDKLRALLLDDNVMVNEKGKLAKLPARFTVDQMIAEYAQELKGTDSQGGNDEALVEYASGAEAAVLGVDEAIQSSLGVVDYFNALIGTQLLYSTEHQQFAELCQPAHPGPMDDEGRGRHRPADVLEMPEEVTVVPSSIYGLPHLLRHFTRIGPMMAQTVWSERSLAHILKHLHDLLVWLSKNSARFFDLHEDYEAGRPKID